MPTDNILKKAEEDYIKLFSHINNKFSNLNELLIDSHKELSKLHSVNMTKYGWEFRDSLNPEGGEELQNLEKFEDELFLLLIESIDLYYKYRTYSKLFNGLTFKEFSSLCVTEKFDSLNSIER